MTYNRVIFPPNVHFHVFLMCEKRRLQVLAQMVFHVIFDIPESWELTGSLLPTRTFETVFGSVRKENSSQLMRA